MSNNVTAPALHIITLSPRLISNYCTNNTALQTNIYIYIYIYNLASYICQCDAYVVVFSFNTHPGPITKSCRCSYPKDKQNYCLVM